MRHLARFCLSLCFCLHFLCTARATPIAAGTYTLNGITVNGSALTGAITLGTDGLATAASFSYANMSYNNPTFSTVVSKGVAGYNPAANFAYISGSNGMVALYYLQTLNAAGGISLCGASTGCAQASNLQMYYPYLNSGLVGGSLTPDVVSVAVTPEPSTFVLMVTGVCMIGAVAGMRRNRKGAPVA